jgi:hypothetical protein
MMSMNSPRSLSMIPTVGSPESVASNQASVAWQAVGKAGWAARETMTRGTDSLSVE